jgi:hypothetical protein
MLLGNTYVGHQSSTVRASWQKNNVVVKVRAQQNKHVRVSHNAVELHHTLGCHSIV